MFSMVGEEGLARRPDSLHNISLYQPTSEVLISQSNVIKPAWVALWSKFRNDPYKGLLPVTSGAFVDSGSKTAIICPFQEIDFPNSVHYLTGSIMGTPPEGPSVGAADPLGLFHNGQYVTLPRHLVPSFGAIYSPILPQGPLPTGNVGSFGQGINFGLMSRAGFTDNSTYINYTHLTVTCAVFSTHNLSTLAPATYNAPLVYGFTYAGARFFNDVVSPGSLSTARGLDRQGIECPPYYGFARVWAVYEAEDYAANGSAFLIASTRAPRTDGGGAKNLLRQNFDGPTFWVERDNVGVSTFVLMLMS